MSRFWPTAETAQADYERLRDAVMSTGELPDDLASARFRHRGLAGLVAWPVSEPVYATVIVGAARPPWTPHHDPRALVLAGVYGLLLGWADRGMTGAGSGYSTAGRGN